MYCTACNQKLPLPAMPRPRPKSDRDSRTSRPSGGRSATSRPATTPTPANPDRARAIDRSADSDYGLAPRRDQRADDDFWGDLQPKSKVQGPLKVPSSGQRPTPAPLRGALSDRPFAPRRQFGGIPNWLKVTGSLLVALLLVAGTGIRLAGKINRVIRRSGIDEKLDEAAQKQTAWEPARPPSGDDSDEAARQTPPDGVQPPAPRAFSDARDDSLSSKAPADSAPLVPALTPPEQITQALADLTSGDRSRFWQAAARLENLQPDQRRDEVARALEPLLGDPDRNVRFHAVRALAVWATAANIDALIAALDTADHGMVEPCVAALAQIQDPRAAAAIAAQLPTHTFAAARALKSLGPTAEEPTLKFLKSPDAGVRRAACEVLQAVGSQKSLRELKKLADDVFVRNQAEAAFYAIQTRVDQAQRETGEVKRAGKETAKASGDSSGQSSSSDAAPGVPRALRRVEK